ncbi:hypothetical protein QN372_20880, partial [Undibacterium sp. RTI2.1]|uniref:hypothetical protein n=1 Tax=unclassified Undibacterium TaxID=2630295 RepID=UPI002B22F056
MNQLYSNAYWTLAPFRKLTSQSFSNCVQWHRPGCPSAGAHFTLAKIHHGTPMELIKHLLTREPLLALFATIALGYLVGKIKVGRFVLGGIAGTLLVGVVIGQL